TVLPTITVRDRLTLERGTRIIDILHLGSGHTAADLVVHLPRERIVATGDLVVFPVPLVGDPQSHIAEWGATLGRLRALNAATIVPGHGPILRDDAHIRRVEEMFASIATQAEAAVRAGDTGDAARRRVDLQPWREGLAGDSPVRRALFSMYVAQPAVSAALRQAAGAPGSGTASLADEVRAAETAFARTMAARDHAAFTSMISEEAIFLGSRALHGRSAVSEGWKPLFEKPEA